MKLKLKWISILTLVVALSVGCSNDIATTDEQTSTPTIKELVHDYTIGTAEAASASITSSELIVTGEDEKVTKYDLPEDQFFVSIAPFQTTTHPCAIHSLTGCQGELVEEEFDVHIEDSQGNVILDETKKTEANGFIDLWLPRDDEFTVTIQQGDQETTSDITSFDGDNTCITTMQLG